MKRILGVLGYGLVLCLFIVAVLGVLEAAKVTLTDLLTEVLWAVIGL